MHSPYAKDRYWHRMRAFIRGQCSRRELDDLASELLVSEHVSLHNRFVRAIHHNVQPFVVPAEAHGGMVAVRSGRDDEAAGFVDGELAQLRSGGLSRRDQRVASYDVVVLCFRLCSSRYFSSHFRSARARLDSLVIAGGIGKLAAYVGMLEAEVSFPTQY